MYKKIYVSVKLFRDKSVTLHMSNFMRNADNFLFKFSLFIFYNFFYFLNSGELSKPQFQLSHTTLSVIKPFRWYS